MQQLKDIFKEGSTNIYRWPDCATPMINEINELNPSKVLDLGCGANLYRGMIDNLTGIDFATPAEADNQLYNRRFTHLKIIA